MLRMLYDEVNGFGEKYREVIERLVTSKTVKIMINLWSIKLW